MSERGAQLAAEGSGASAAERAPRLPDFFIVGHEKCGTSALDAMLKRHPQIFMPEIKEQRFFAPELRSRFGVRDTKFRPATLEGYLALFAAVPSAQRAGEASPMYLRSHEAAQRIAEVQPRARIIAILREPARYLRSMHLQNVSNNYESQQNLRKAIALEPARREGRRIPRRCASPPALFYSDHVRYVEQLRRYHSLFGRERVLVLIYEEYRRDNASALREVLRFLDVDDTLTLETVETKPLKAVRFMQLKYLSDAARLARRNPAGASVLGRAANALTPSALRSEGARRIWWRMVNRDARPPDEQLMLEIRRRFKGEVTALSDYLGRDLVTLWGYDRID